MESRKHHRYRVRFRSSFSSGETVSGEGTLVELSVRGCRISSKTGVTQGTELELRLYLPPENQEPPVVIKGAVVRWAKAPEFGVEFPQLTGEIPERLRRVIKTLIPII